MAERGLNPKQQRFVAIYTLSTSDGCVRYVGKAIDPDKRLKQHLCSRANTPVARWVRKLRLDGKRPEMRVIEWTNEWEAAERRWIATHRANGSLLNLADGGAGVPGAISDWAIRNAAEYAAELLGRIKPFADWLQERKRTGCEVLLYWAVARNLAEVRRSALLTRP